MTVREGTVDSGGVSLHYLDWGGEGPPLILLHATGFHSWLWDPIATQLTHRFRVVAYDQRGHGDSDGPPDGYSFEQFAEDLDAVINGLGLERSGGAGGARDAASRVSAVGHSSGASTIAVHAARHPGVISRATLLEPILPHKSWRTNGANMRAEQARRRRGVWPSREELFESYRTRPPFNTWREDVLHIYIEKGTRFREDGQVELKCPPHLEAFYYDAVREADFYPLLRQVRCPTLFVWGSENDLERRTASAAQSAMTYAQSITIPGATHFLPQEKPDEVVRLLQDDSLYMEPALGAARK